MWSNLRKGTDSKVKHVNVMSNKDLRSIARTGTTPVWFRKNLLIKEKNKFLSLMLETRGHFGKFQKHVIHVYNLSCEYQINIYFMSK